VTTFSEAWELLCGLVMPDGRAWGQIATGVQRRDSRAVLSPRGPRRHWIGRARGYSKTEDLAALSLVAMLVLLVSGQEAYCVARDRDQARILVDRIRGFIRRTGLEGAFDQIGTYVLVTKAGLRFEALSADSASAWGLSPAWVVIDELCQHPETSAARELFDAITTGLPKVRGSRLAVITTAGSPGHWSRVVYDHAVREPTWRVSMTTGPAPWMDPTEVDEARRSLPESMFSRLFMNMWAQAEDRLFRPEDVEGCVTLDGAVAYRPGRTYVVAVDASLRRDRTAVVVGHLHGRGATSSVMVDSLDVFTPSRHADIDLGTVEALLLARSGQYGRAPVIYDPAGMWQMAQRLTSRGVRTIEHAFSVSSNSRRTLLLLQIVRERRLQMPADRDLIDEMLNVRVREVGPNQYRIDHDPSRHDDRVTALSLVVLHLLEHAGGSASAWKPTGTVRSPAPGARSLRPRGEWLRMPETGRLIGRPQGRRPARRP
jgi:hypothetical protein